MMSHSYDMKPLCKRITRSCGVFICLQWYKNYKSQPRNARVIVYNKMALFLPDTVYIFLAREITLIYKS